MSKAVAEHEPRHKRPGNEYVPWKRSSGELMRAVLSQLLTKKFQTRYQALLANAQLSVIVGDPQRKVDLMILGAKSWLPSIALVDLSAFDAEKHSQRAIVDYYFQLKRATPSLEPIFVFLHELADERSASFQTLMRHLNELLDDDQH